MTKHLAFLALAAAALTRATRTAVSRAHASLQAARDADVTRDLAGPGAVYTLTNQAASNAVAVFTRGADGGSARPAASQREGPARARVWLAGRGLADHDGRLLFAVNAGSNDVSVFAVSPAGLALASRTASGGTLPSA